MKFDTMTYSEILQRQKKFFRSHTTKNPDFRKAQLKKLKKLILENENMLFEAIDKDFGKSRFDTFMTEISFIYKDIDYFLKNMNRLVRPESVSTNLVNQIATSKIHYEPLGNVLVIGAWNYPYQLSLTPAIAAIAAGNTCIIKPSEIPENTMKAMSKLINENFDVDFLYVAEGAVEETTEILQLKFDKIFFTGSTKVGKIVYEAAAKNLTPVVLELGGKSPTIVSETADLDVAAKRIVWGKFLNGGQTCVAPDYVLVHDKVKMQFLELLKKYIAKFNYQPESKHYTRIINEQNFDRIVSVINNEKVFLGGKSDREKLHIEPTVLADVSTDDEVMKEEIFGPVLPVLGYINFDDALNFILDGEKPLAAYLFTKNSEEKKKFTENISFGGGCINDVIMHLGNDNLPFGGVGNSGMGNYHGDFGFETFSHMKPVMDRATWGEPNLKYPPYSDEKLNWIKKVL